MAGDYRITGRGLCHVSSCRFQVSLCPTSYTCSLAWSMSFGSYLALFLLLSFNGIIWILQSILSSFKRPGSLK